jgi:hypothetical protein
LWWQQRLCWWCWRAPFFWIYLWVVVVVVMVMVVVVVVVVAVAASTGGWARGALRGDLIIFIFFKFFLQRVVEP